MTVEKSRAELVAELEELRYRFEEAEETLRAIGCGEVDAFVVSGAQGAQVFTLKGAEQPYRVLVETMNEGAATLAADGTIIYCNSRLAAMLQVPLEKLIGTGLVSYVAPADHHLLLARLESCSQSCDSDEIAMLTGAGDALPVLISCCASADSGSRQLSVVLTDLSQKKRNEEIIASERLARSIIEQAGEAILVCDEKGRIIQASRLVHELSGSNPFLKPFNELFQMRIVDTDCLFSVATPLSGGSFESIEVEFSRSDGRIFHLLLNATPLKNVQNRIIGCVVTLTDFSERREAEEQLRLSENRYRSLFENMMEGFAYCRMLYDDQGTPVDYIYLEVNDAFERLTGLKDPRGRRVTEVVPEVWKSSQELFAICSRVALSGKPEKIETQLAPLSLWLSISVYSTERDYFLIVFDDITKRKTAEEALKRVNEELEERVAARTAELAANMEQLTGETAERVRAVESLREKEQLLIQQSRQAAMGEMIGNIAHQWRQPLNALGLTIQKLELFYELGDFNKEFLTESVASSMDLIEHMSSTIDDFRNFFKPDKEKTVFSVCEATTNTLTLIEDSFRSQQVSIAVVAATDPVIYGYRNEFTQVLLNLLNNARDVLTERGVKAPQVTITISGAAGCAMVSIADNAGGVPEEILNKIFDPYFTTKGPQQGTGVGLFMSKIIIEKNMGGRLTVRNTNEGAEFRIEV